MRIYAFFVSLAVVATLFSCKEDTDLEDIKLIDYGIVKYKFTDDSGKPVTGATVKLYQVFGEYNTVLLSNQVSDADGLVSFDKLNAGTYGLRTEQATVGNIEYIVDKTFQVNVDVDTLTTIDVTKFSNDARLSVFKTDYWNPELREPLANYGVLAIKAYGSDIDSYQITPLMEEHALAVAYTDEQGSALIKKIPTGVDYAFYVFDRTSKAIIGSTYITQYGTGQLSEIEVPIYTY